MKRRVLTLCVLVAMLTMALVPVTGSYALSTPTNVEPAETQQPTAEPAPTEAATAEPTEVASKEPTAALATEVPVTEAPATEVPATEIPATDVPATEIPTEAPTAEPARESATDWANSVSAAVLNGEWAHDILAVAATQIGYGEQDGYVRYAAWYGEDAAKEWSAMFVGFVVKHAGIAHADFPYAPDAAGTLSALDDMGAFATDLQPKVGDLVFFTNDGASAQHVAIISAVNGSSIETIEGDVNGHVARCTYAMDDALILGYADTALLEERSKIDNTMPDDVPAIPAEGMTAYLCASDVNMRASATTDSERVGRIKKYGSELNVIGAEKNDLGEVWYVVVYGDVTGYVRADFVTLTQPAATKAPEATAEPTAEPTVEVTAEPTAEPTVEVTAEPTVEVTVEPTAEPTTEPVIIPADVIPTEDIPATSTDVEEPADDAVEQPMMPAQPVVITTPEPSSMTIISQPESNWQPGDEDTSLSFIVENAVSYLWQQGRTNSDGSMSWNDILNSNTSTLSFYANEDTLPYAYRSIATDADGASVTSDYTFLLPSEWIPWAWENNASLEMILRALRVGSLDKIVLEGNYFVDVRTGKNVACRVYDANEKVYYVIDLNTQLIVATMLNDNEIVPYNAQ